ncbi:hypothetical protein [Streptomyces sp. NPDC012466]|uniref:hypothetical protein n=1 Tax=Streptomyces sp. NPDC012466 TaxID=3364835 RepID=UPI0036E30717
MHSHWSFEKPPALPHEVVVETLKRAMRDRSAEGEAAGVLVGTALDSDDAGFVEHWCVQVGTRAVSGSPWLGLAGLCLGHIARRFGHLSYEARALAESLATRAEADPSDVDGRALDGWDDARSFLHLW